MFWNLFGFCSLSETHNAARDPVRGTNVALIDARPRRMIPAMLAAVVVLITSPRAALAQAGDTLPSDISTSVVLNESQKSAIKDFVEAIKGSLVSEDASKVREAMDKLRSPFTAASIPNISYSFRHDYATALLPTLTEMMSAKNLANAESDMPIRALSIAGELATDDATSLMVKALGASRADVRYQAAYAVRRTFFMIAQSRTANPMTPEAVSSLLKVVGNHAADEHDSLVLDALVRAIEAASQKDEHRSESIRALGEAITSNAKNAGPTADPSQASAMLRAATVMRDMLSNPGNGTLGQEVAKSAAQMGGQLVAYASRAVSSKKIGPAGGDVRLTIADLATASQNVVLLAYTKIKIGEPAPNVQPLGDPLRAGTVQGDAEFLIRAGNFVEQVLSKSPFGFDAGSFKM